MQPSRLGQRSQVPVKSTVLRQPSNFIEQKPAQEIIVQVRSEIGLNRLTVKSNNTIKELVEMTAKTINKAPESIIIAVEGREVPTRSYNLQVVSLPGFEMGCTVTVKQNSQAQQRMEEYNPVQKNVIYNIQGQVVSEDKLQKLEHTLKNQDLQKQKEHVLSQYCNHGPMARCVNCLKQEVQRSEKTVNTANCNHREGAKCLNCCVVTKEELKNPKNTTLLCQHGPNGKCTHCLDDGQITNIKHLSFDQYLAESKLKCKGCHPLDAKCNNCLPPTSVSYRLKQDCKNHAPWPQAMCNSCLPPGVVLKRQVYRHVDYVEFLNIPEISNFVQYWISKGKTEQRVGFLYGYYAEDVNYKGGVRAVVEAIYEPPQKGSVGSFELMMDPFENDLNQIAAHLGLERIGWIFTSINHDCFLTSQEMRMAARLQHEFNVLHESGCRVSKFLTVVLRPKKDSPEEIVPEVYMVSDQMQQLEYDGVFQDSGRRKVLQLRKPASDKDIIPNFVQEGKSVTEFEPDFFIVNVAHGYSPNSSYNILKLYDFPVENRTTIIKQQDVKNHLIKHQKKPSSVRYSNFHLLLFLCKLIDMDSVAIIAQSIGEEYEVSEEIQEVIKLYVNQ